MNINSIRITAKKLKPDTLTLAAYEYWTAYEQCELCGISRREHVIYKHEKDSTVFRAYCPPVDYLLRESEHRLRLSKTERPISS